MTINRVFPNFASGALEKSKEQGFTLIELMISIALLAILLGLAAPSYRSFITSNRLTAQANELVGDLTLARNEAASRSRKVQVCIASSSSTDASNASCAGSGNDWSAGWIIWDPVAGTVIKYTDPRKLSGNASMTASGPSDTSVLVYLPFGGHSSGNTWTFKLCSPGDTAGRTVTVPITGRAVAKRITTCP